MEKLTFKFYMQHWHWGLLQKSLIATTITAATIIAAVVVATPGPRAAVGLVAGKYTSATCLSFYIEPKNAQPKRLCLHLVRVCSLSRSPASVC